MAMKQSTKDVIKYLQAHKNGETADEIAKQLGLEKKIVVGAFNMAIAKPKRGERVTAVDAQGNEVTLLRLTEAGFALDVDAQ